jgi:peptidoglycan/xylan/chitin deacetylase (PgdA/CDA1 family)
MFFPKTPNFIKGYYKSLTWNVPTLEKDLYLSFDDGPTEEVTGWVLDQLKAYNAKATFFCIGKNVKKHPAIYQRILEEGHAVGNHSYSHLKGWKTKNADYFKDIIKCSKWVDSTLLRPPYGKIKKSQIKPLLKRYHIIMWDVLSGDYSAEVSEIDCTQNVISQAREGSIVVFHDSVKASKNLYYALPKCLAHFHQLGFKFKGLHS